MKNILNTFFLHFIKQFKDINQKGLKELVKKIMILLLMIIKFPIYLFAFAAYLLMHLIKPIIIIRVSCIPCINFGDMVAFTALYIVKKKMKIDQPKKLFVDLIYLNSKKEVSNTYLLKMWKKQIFIFPSFFLKQLDQIIRLMKSQDSFSIPLLNYKHEYDVDNLFEKHQSLKFSQTEQETGLVNLKKFGLHPDDKFVCLSVRDSAYNQKIKFSNSEKNFMEGNIYHNKFRDFKIKNFKEAAEALANRGYYVFRMGAKVKEKLKSNNKKIIDYANSNLRSEFMDIFLGAKCNFCISTGHGFDMLPYVFNKPIGIMSVPVGDLRSHSKRFLLLTRKHYSLNKKKNLSLLEIFNSKVGFAYKQEIFEKEGIDLIDYTPEEIKNFSLELCDYYENKKELSMEEVELQKKFKNNFFNLINQDNYQSQIDKPYNKIQDKIRSNFFGEFLIKNKEWLD
jgi:putative glycosyltransferase (TIGR04372 family)